jgi:hypothetical protein
MAAAANSYRRTLQPVIGDAAWRDLQRRAWSHLGGCLLARVDGKSKVDYLAELPQGEVRRLGRDLLCGRTDDALIAPLLEP